MENNTKEVDDWEKHYIKCLLTCRELANSTSLREDLSKLKSSVKKSSSIMQLNIDNMKNTLKGKLSEAQILENSIASLKERIESKEISQISSVLSITNREIENAEILATSNISSIESLRDRIELHLKYISEIKVILIIRKRSISLLFGFERSQLRRQKIKKGLSARYLACKLR
jgi:alanyl-tRNA synthetase